MRKLLTLVIAVLLTEQIGMFGVAAKEPVNIYVSEKGSITGSGEINDPVNSIQSAILLCEKFSGEDINILFDAGEYQICDTAVFNGFDKNNVTFKANGDKDVIFTGAVRLNSQKFSNVSDASILKRIPREARSKVLQYNLSESGVKYSLSDSKRPYLFVNGNMQTKARYPNNEHLTAKTADGTTSFEVLDYDVSKWNRAKDTVLVGSVLSTYFWRNCNISVSEKNITSDTKIRKDAEYFVENLIEELDSPGEYFVDRENNILYYYPSCELSDSTIEITSFLDTAVVMKNSKNVTFDGLTFEKIGGNAFDITNAENVNIINCNINYIQGDNAINITGNNCVISDNSFYGCSDNVILFHGGSVKTLMAGNVEIKNNRISFCGYEGRHSIISSGSDATTTPVDFGNKIKNNIIQDCMTFMGISCNANDYEIKYNEIVNQGYLIGDGGAIYMGKSNVKYGTEAAYNYIHDGHKNDPQYAYCGLYSDDGYSGTNFHHNIVKDMYQGVIAGIGMNCMINDNLFINNSNASGIGSRMTSYSVSNGAVDSGMQGMMYNEANDLITKTTYGSKFAAYYPQIKEGLERKPYFAPWNSEFTGNVTIGGKTISERPWHPYYKIDGTTPVFSSEADYINDQGYEIQYGKKYIGSYLYEGAIVDEFSLYGAKIEDGYGNDLNCTPLGNPVFDYDERYFTDAKNQDFTLTDEFSCDVSDVKSIDMSAIGIISTTNPSIFNVNAETPDLIYPENGQQNVDSNVKFVWNRVKNASKYNIIVSKNADFSDAVINETFNDTADALIKEYTLENESKYYWKVTAYGLAKNDSFEIISNTFTFTTKSSNFLDKNNLEFAVGILDKQIADYKNGYFTYTDESIKDEVEEESIRTKFVLENANTQDELDVQEDSVLNILEMSAEYIENSNPEIKECYVDKNNDNVYVKGVGFGKNTKVSVLVTNPDYDNITAKEEFDLTSVQYTDTLTADGTGVIEFVFNTRINNEDRSGDYTLYLGYNGKILKKTYNYGIISAGNITYKNSDGEIISDLSEYSGKTITMCCDIDNDTNMTISPAAVTAFYNNDKLYSVLVNTDNIINEKEEKEIVWEAYIPENFSKVTQIKVLFVDSMITLSPLTKAKVIFEKDVT